jgi:hypothetical protein
MKRHPMGSYEKIKGILTPNYNQYVLGKGNCVAYNQKPICKCL